MSLKKLFDLSWAQKCLLLKALVLLPLLGLSLKLFGFKKSFRHTLSYQKSYLNTDTQINQIEKARSIARITSMAAYHGIYRANCLCRSLFLMRLLYKRNIPCQLVIGADKSFSNSRLSAHAWVESYDQIINDSCDVHKRFKAFPLSH